MAGVSLMALALALPASASTITARKIGFSDGDRQIIINDGQADERVTRAGRYVLTTTTLQELFLWCVDIFNSVSPGVFPLPGQIYETGDLTNDGDTPPNALSSDQISRVNGLVADGNDALAGSPVDAAAVSAAFQAAIWQTIYPTMTFTSSNQTLQAMITALNDDDTFAGGGGILYTPVDANGEPVESQKLFGSAPQPVNPVPTPAAIGLFGFALAGLLVARRATA
ncbi:hypothetical protein DFH01_19200 [Falsiroseomonas bella]|uniref:VPLPA-CTERM sorting domain-containing protein n=1 Tax=Falsiroseomonas bella TaxID=2184016 RepID=A0A317FDT3_9PROT|nr:PEP-CTERM sorting domain-containing protein [Falsiroseomonas bella]PWS35716.1 hypothetical protein DFH01_19200 [Falsiroseomonas bella]